MNLYEVIGNYYSEIFPLSDTKIKFLDNYLKNTKSIIDIGTATGDLAIHYAKKGKKVTGFDLDDNMIKTAIDKAKKNNVEVTFLIKNMLNINKLDSADAIICLGNTASHLASLDSFKEFLSNCYSKLNKNGQLIIQNINYERLELNTPFDLPVIDRPNVLFKRQHILKTEKKIQFKTEVTLKSNGDKFESTTLLTAFTQSDFYQTLTNLNFIEINFFSGYEGSPFKKDGSGLIVTAKK